MALLSAPDAVQLSQVISQATAPAFVLGAVAGFVSILVGRLTAVIERIRHLNDIAPASLPLLALGLANVTETSSRFHAPPFPALAN